MKKFKGTIGPFYFKIVEAKNKEEAWLMLFGLMQVTKRLAPFFNVKEIKND